MEDIGGPGSGPYEIVPGVRLSCHPDGIPGPYRCSMDTWYCCPDCGAEHLDPGDPALGHRVRCLGCQLEIDHAFEIRTLPAELIAA